MMYNQTEINSSYLVNYWMGNKALTESASLLDDNAVVFILVDEMTDKACLPLLQAVWPQTINAHIVSINSGELNKNLETVGIIWDFLTEHHADRHSVLVNLGGGVITDIGGFAAAAYKRGMQFVHIPTTLLAQVDAAIGGKTGVDFNGLKNHIGFFKDPKAVIIDPVFLNTLDSRQWRSGFAEVMKYGLIMDRELWELIKMQNIEQIEREALEEMIVRSAKNKIEIVKEDSQESGRRKILNFGHTLGHALETYFLTADRPITHGEAVAAGMICESWISMKISGLEQDEFTEIQKVIDKVFPRLRFTENEIPRLLDLTRQDKKARGGKIRYSLIDKIGSSLYDIEISDQIAEESLRYYIVNQ
ncbi:MAG: 3-dehydroquinate synthase [Bacteroidales bacterium]|nr:3-dehydroquinate synthase [Bacteroidales bacterium]